jgi:hypothetical protein
MALLFELCRELSVAESVKQMGYVSDDCEIVVLQPSRFQILHSGVSRPAPYPMGEAAWAWDSVEVKNEWNCTSAPPQCFMCSGLANKLLGAEPFLKSRQLCSYSRIKKKNDGAQR